MILTNADATTNIVFGNPNKVQEREIGNTRHETMPPPANLSARAYIPDIPGWCCRRRAWGAGESDTLKFNAPTAPGSTASCARSRLHVRMYGVMLVVPSLDAFSRGRPTRRPIHSRGEPWVAAPATVTVLPWLRILRNHGRSSADALPQDVARAVAGEVLSWVAWARRERACRARCPLLQATFRQQQFWGVPAADRCPEREYQSRPRPRRRQVRRRSDPPTTSPRPGVSEPRSPRRRGHRAPRRRRARSRRRCPRLLALLLP